MTIKASDAKELNITSKLKKVLDTKWDSIFDMSCTHM